MNEAWHILGDRARRTAFDDGTAKAVAYAPSAESGAGEEAVDHGEAPVPRRIHLLVIGTVALLVAVGVAIFLIGFGRVGVRPQP